MRKKTQKWPQDGVACSHACDYCVAELTEDHKRTLHFGGTPRPPLLLCESSRLFTGEVNDQQLQFKK